MDALLTAVSSHSWLAVSALVIGLLVRLLKSDTWGPTLPAKYRPWAALALGCASAVLEKVMAGASWQTALVDGLGSALAAVAGHDLVVESLLGGKELPVPGLMKNSPPPMPTFFGMTLFHTFAVFSTLGVMTCACSWLQQPQNVGMVAKDVACVIQHDTDPPAKIVAECNLVGDALKEVAAIVNESRASKARFAAAVRCDAGPAPDAGVPVYVPMVGE